MVEILQDHGANPDARYKNTNVMHQIIARSDLVQLFVDLPSLDLEVRDGFGATLLLTACLSRNQDANLTGSDGMIINKLLNCGADVRARDTSGRNALHHLFESRISVEASGPGMDTRALNRITTEAPELVNQTDSKGDPPFYAAIERFNCGSNIEDVEVLISAGANVQLANRKYDTPLHLMFGCIWELDSQGFVIGRRRKLFDRFVESGLDINARNHAGETPVFSFFRCGFGRVRVQFPGPKPRRTTRGKIEEGRKVREEPLFEFFHQTGVQWDVVNKKGETLLHG